MKATFVQAAILVLWIFKEALLVEMLKLGVVRMALVDLSLALHELSPHLAR
jgi:hypothetical protein